MGSLFGSKPSVVTQAAPAASAVAQELPKPRVKRMPTESDPSMLAAAQRTRKAAMQRAGRLSTILTDQSAGVMGSSGQSLGA